MAFKYIAVTTKTNPASQFFEEAHPTEFTTLTNFFKSQPGFISGKWGVSPFNPAQFIAEHTWTTQAAWEAAAIAALSLSETVLLNTYGIQQRFFTAKTFTEV